MQNTCAECETILPRDSEFCPRCGTPAPTDIPEEFLASATSDPTGMLERLRKATEGEFTIIRELGRGGMGRVMLAHEIGLDRRVAMKVLPPALADHAEIVERFQREARTAGKLSHPNIVSVYQVYERGGFTFFTMPYVAGPSLRQVMRKTPQLPFQLVRRYLREAADALGYAHGKGVIHRDIKPENMLLEGSQDGRLMLTDFGIAKALGLGTTLTRPGDMMGTPYYMSPEQCSDKAEIDPRSDQYSLGLVGYEMLAGKFPFTADSMAAIVYRHLHEYPEPLEEVRPDVPEALKSVIWKAIQKEKDKRFPTMAGFLAALGTRSARPPAVQPPPLSKKRAPRRKALVWGTAAVVALAAASGGFLVWKAQAGSGGSTAQLAELTVPPTFPDSAAGGDSDGTTRTDDGERQGGEAEAATGGNPAGGSGPTADASSGDSERPDPGRARLERRLRAARDNMSSARVSALEAGASLFLAGELQVIDAERDRAGGLERRGDLAGAAAAYEALVGRYEDLGERASEAAVVAQRDDTAGRVPGGTADTVTIGGGEDEVPEGGDTGGETPPEASPEEAIDALIETYRQAFEAEDLDRLSREVYAGEIPSGDTGSDAQLLKLFFNRGERYRVQVERTGIDVTGTRATVSVTQHMEFVLSRTDDRRRTDLELQLIFERGDEGWRLTTLGRP